MRFVCSSEKRFETVDQITSLISKNGVSLITQDIITSPKICPQTNEALKKIERRNKNSNRKMQFRQFTMQGNFPAMISLVSKLADEIEYAFPVAIELEPAETEKDQQTWHLVVVM